MLIINWFSHFFLKELLSKDDHYKDGIFVVGGGKKERERETLWRVRECDLHPPRLLPSQLLAHSEVTLAA
jgi:hypothetical protein